MTERLEAQDADQLVRALDTPSRREEERVWKLLAPLGGSVVVHLAAAYPTFRCWQGRASLVYHALPYGRTLEPAFSLGLAAATDRSGVVRYRAISLLAYALRRDALPLLQSLLAHPMRQTAEDAAAAIDAIESGNHHLFHDRTHSGKVTWRVQGADGDA